MNGHHCFLFSPANDISGFLHFLVLETDSPWRRTNFFLRSKLSYLQMWHWAKLALWETCSPLLCQQEVLWQPRDPGRWHGKNLWKSFSPEVCLMSRNLKLWQLMFSAWLVKWRRLEMALECSGAQDRMGCGTVLLLSLRQQEFLLIPEFDGLWFAEAKY